MPSPHKGTGQPCTPPARRIATDLSQPRFFDCCSCPATGGPRRSWVDNIFAGGWRMKTAGGWRRSGGGWVGGDDQLLDPAAELDVLLPVLRRRQRRVRRNRTLPPRPNRAAPAAEAPAQRPALAPGSRRLRHGGHGGGGGPGSIVDSCSFPHCGCGGGGRCIAAARDLSLPAHAAGAGCRRRSVVVR
jgi:hypothetical protein